MTKNTLLLTGAITFENVMNQLAQSKIYFAENRELIFDFAKVTASDSSALALIVEWIKMAREQEKLIEIINLPANLQAIAEIAGMAMFFKNE